MIGSLHSFLCFELGALCLAFVFCALFFDVSED